MTSTKFLSPNYIEKANLSGKLSAFAHNVLRVSWLNYTICSPLFEELYPWEEQRTMDLLQKCYEDKFKYNWLSFVKLAKLINEHGEHAACCMELCYAACHEWGRKDFSNNRTICIYSSLDRDIIMVGKKSLDPAFLCKLSVVPIAQRLPITEQNFYKIAILSENKKFSIDDLKDIEFYE